MSFLSLPSVPARPCSCVSVLCVPSVLSLSALAGPWHGVCVLLTESYCGSESPARGHGDDEPSFPPVRLARCQPLLIASILNCGLLTLAHALARLIYHPSLLSSYPPCPTPPAGPRSMICEGPDGLIHTHMTEDNALPALPALPARSPRSLSLQLLPILRHPPPPYPNPKYPLQMLEQLPRVPHLISAPSTLSGSPETGPDLVRPTVLGRGGPRPRRMSAGANLHV